MKKMLLSLTLCASLLLPLFPIGAKAAEATETATSEQPIAELALSPNRTKGIVSMTFDDGSVPTAQWLNEKFKQYNLYGSTMLITNNNINSPDKIETWKAIYADGRLEPECHTYTHMVLPTDLWANANNPSTLENNTEENFKREIYDSGVMIQEAFGKFPLCIAPSNNTMCDGGMKHVKKYYYAMRQGSRYNSGEVQSLDPIPGSHERGGWYNLLMSGTKSSEGKILEGLNTAARNGGWLVVMCHGIGADSGDSTYEKFEPVLQQMSMLQESGLVWVTTFGNATKYIRQRQNTQVNIARENDTTYRVTLSMSQYTADGLPLPKSEFNLPLTVRFRLPEGATHMICDLGNGETVYEGIKEADGTFVYLNMRAGKDVAKVRFCNEEGQTILKQELFTLKHSLALGEMLDYTFYIRTDIELLRAKIADGEYTDASSLEKVMVRGEEFYALHYKIPLGDAPKNFQIAVVASVGGKEGARVFNCSIFNYLHALLNDEHSEDMQMLALNAMILLRDVANEKKISINTVAVQDAIMKYHYMPKAPDEFKNATTVDTSKLHASISFDLPDRLAIVLTPELGRSTDSYTFIDKNGNALKATVENGNLVLYRSITNITEGFQVVYTDGDVVQTLSYSLCDDYARIKTKGLMASVYTSLYRTSLACLEIE